MKQGDPKLFHASVYNQSTNKALRTLKIVYLIFIHTNFFIHMIYRFSSLVKQYPELSNLLFQWIFSLFSVLLKWNTILVERANISISKPKTDVVWQLFRNNFHSRIRIFYSVYWKTWTLNPYVYRIFSRELLSRYQFQCIKIVQTILEFMAKMKKLCY